MALQFDPSQPFEVVEEETLDSLTAPRVRPPAVAAPAIVGPAFDPSKPFTAVPEVAAPSGPVFNPNAPVQKIFSIEDFANKSVDELVADKDYQPVNFGVQNKDALLADPELQSKQERVYRARETAGTTAMDKLRAAKKGALPGLEALFSGVKQTAKTAEKFSLAGAGTRLFNALASPEGSATALAKDYGKTGAELAASVELASLGTVDLARRAVRELGESKLPLVPALSAVNKPKAQQTEGDWRNRYFNDVELAQKVEEAGRGNAEVMKLVGIDAETLQAEHGITLDPQVISELSVVTNPVNYVPVGAVVGAVTNVGGKLVTRGLAAAKSAAQASEFAGILNKAAEAATVTSGVAGGALKSVGGAIEATGNAAQAVVRSTLGRGVGYGVGLGSLLGGNVYKALGGLAIAKGIPKALQVGGSALKRTGAVIAGEAELPAALSLAGQTAKQATLGGLQAGVEGTIISLPFEIGARPEEEEQILGFVALGAAAGAGIRGARPGVRATGRAAQNKLAETIFQHVEQADAPETPRYEGAPDALNNAHEAAYAKLSPSDKKLVNWGRRLAPAEDLQIFALDSAGMKAETGSATAKGYAVKISERADGKPVVHIYLNTDAQALPHEFFHALEILDPKPAKSLIDSVKKTLTPAEFKSFEQQYNSALNNGHPEKFWKTRLTKDEVYREIAAEGFSRTFLAQDLSGVAPAVRQKAALFVSSLLEKLGAPLAGVGKPKGTPGATALGVRPGTEQVKLGQQWLGDILSRVNDDGTLATAPAKVEKAPITVAEAILSADDLEVATALRRTQVSDKAIAKHFGITEADVVKVLGAGPTKAPVRPRPTPTAPVVTPAPAAPPSVPPPNTPIAPPSPAAPRNIRTTRTVPKDAAGERSQVTGIEEAKASAAATGDANTIARVNELSELLNQPVEIVHSGAKAAGTVESPSGRTVRRAEIASGGIREKYSKVTIPDRWVVVAGKPQLLAFSLDKIFTNMDTLAAKAAEKGVSEKIPYPTEKGKFSEATAEQILDGISAYAENQRNGRKGDGTPLTRPTEEIGISIPPENPDYVPRKLADDAALAEQRMNFINALMGTDPFVPRTARETTGQVPGNVKGQIIAEVNARKPQKPSVMRPEDITKQEFKSGRSISEMNPLRDELAAAGVPMRELLDANERIFARDISQVVPRPDLEIQLPVTDTIRGGFLPAETAGAIRDVQAMSPDEFMAAAKSWDGGLTTQAWKVGLEATTPEDVAALKAANVDASAKARERMKVGSWDAAASWGSKSQFFREAFEAATDSGSAAGDIGWRTAFPDRQAPFPEAKAAPVGAFQPAPAFYSELQRTINEKVKGESIPATQLAALVRNAGIKPEELKWSGLDDYLAGKSKVSVPELKKFLRENEVQLEEVVKESGKAPQTLDEIAQRLYKRDFDYLGTNQKNHVREIFIDEEEAATKTKFQNYQVPGGLNYRELLLTLPGEFKTWRTVDEKGRVQGEGFDKSYADNLARQHTGWRVESDGGRQTATDFKSSHFDEPNVLAHIRFNERTDAAGKKVLFLEEVQSDWHQKGKKEGYKTDAYPARRMELERISAERDFTPAEQVEWDRIADEGHRRPGSAAVPDAPFKKTWPLLAVKRMIRYAAENDFDKVAWTPGDVQAARYDLSKQVSEIQYNPKNQMLVAYDKGAIAREVINQKVEPSKLDDYIGKDAAQKLLDAPLEEFAPENEPVHVLQGDALRVGGEGMRGFYDQILPKEVGAYVKKWGAKVEKIEFNDANRGNNRAAAANLSHNGDRTYQWRDSSGALVGPRFSNQTDAHSWRAGNAVRDADTFDAWSITLTPSMRSDVLTKGQKMFLPKGGGVAPSISPSEITPRSPTVPLPLSPDDLEKRR